MAASHNVTRGGGQHFAKFSHILVSNRLENVLDDWNAIIGKRERESERGSFIIGLVPNGVSRRDLIL